MNFLNTHIKKIKVHKSLILFKVKTYLKNFLFDLFGENMFYRTITWIRNITIKENEYYQFAKKNNNFETDKSKLSIIIPTFNAETDLPSLMKGIQKQQKIQKPELIIIDSNSQDKTVPIAKQFGAKVMHIKQSEFNHGQSRKDAAEKAQGDYVLFMVQDAVPESTTLFAELLSLLLSNKKVGAASPFQCARPDSDIFAQWQTKYTYSSIALKNKDYIFTLPDNNSYYKLPFIIKRKLSLLDNVCCMVDKNVFLELNGFRSIPIAEDVDFAIRLVQKGYSIGLLGTNCIMHSHTRPPLYFLRRYYVGSKTQFALYNEIVHSPFESLHELWDTLKDLYISSCGKNKFLEQLNDIGKQLKINNTSNKNRSISYTIIENEYTYMMEEIQKIEKISDLHEKDVSILRQKICASLLGLHLAKYVLDPYYSGMRKTEEHTLDTVLHKEV